MKRKLTAFLMICIIMLSFTTGITAIEPGGGISPYWLYMDSINVDVNFSGTTGTATLSVSRIYQVTTKLEGTLTVYKQVGNNWVYVDSESATSTRSLAIDFEFSADSGVKYKVVADVTAYGSGKSESDTVSKEKTCP